MTTTPNTDTTVVNTKDDKPHYSSFTPYVEDVYSIITAPEKNCYDLTTIILDFILLLYTTAICSLGILILTEVHEINNVYKIATAIILTVLLCLTTIVIRKLIYEIRYLCNRVD